jgi:hypothetical protein
MVRYIKRHGLPLAVIDNTLLTRLDGLEVAQFLPLLYKQILIPPYDKLDKLGFYLKETERKKFLADAGEE